MNNLQMWFNESIKTIDEKIASGPPYDFSGPLTLCILKIQSTPELSIELLKKMANSGDEQSLVFLGEIYLDGKIRSKDVLVQRNPELGNNYLMKAAELGSTNAMLKLMDEHVEDGVLKYSDPEKALYWLKRAADAGSETACEGWADHMVNGRNAQDCTQQEVDEIEKYYQACYTSPKFYKLARFHSDGILSGDYNGDEYKRACYWLYKGANSSYNFDREQCKELMRDWGIEEKSKETISNGMLILQVIAGGFGLVLCATLGGFFITVANTIMSFTVPIIGAFVVYKLYGVLFSRN